MIHLQARGTNILLNRNSIEIDNSPLSCEDLSLPGLEFSLGGNVDIGDRQATHESSHLPVSFEDLTVHGAEFDDGLETTDYQHMPCSSSRSRVLRGTVSKRGSRRGRKGGMQILRTAMNLRDTTKQTSVTRSRSTRWITPKLGYNRHSTTRMIPYDDTKVIYEWLRSLGDHETVPLINGLQDGAKLLDYPADHEFFRLLLVDRGQIILQHIDAYVGLLLLWSSKTVAYAIWMVTDVHWVLVVMNLSIWTVTVYNSRYGMGDLKRIDSVIDKWCKYTRILLRTSEGCRGMQHMLIPGKQPFYKVMVPVDTCPQTNKWTMCGLYTLKFMELLIVKGGELEAVNFQSIHRFRKKIAVDLYPRNLAA